MKFDVYCDESRPDSLSSTSTAASQFMVIGSLWLPTTRRDPFKQEIHQLRDTHKVGGEFKWQKVTPSREAFYLDLVDWFFQKGEDLRFRCIAVDREKVDLVRFHENDQELGFYKFYYQLLHHWIRDNNEYAIFCDHKSNRMKDRLPVLQRCLNGSNLSSEVTTLQTIRSGESVLTQMADVLTGAAATRLNRADKIASSKFEVINTLESLLGRRIASTPGGESKFNVFKIDLRGGW